MKDWTDKQVIAHARNLAKQECNSIANQIVGLYEMQLRGCYRDIGYSSLFTFLVKDLKYSKTTAQRRVDAVRLYASIPELADRVREGEVNLIASTQMQSILRRHEKATSQKVSKEKKREIFLKLENKSNDEADRILFQELPGAAHSPKETLRRSSAQGSKLSLNIPDELREKLERIKDLSKLDTWADVLDSMANEYLKRKDPLEKAKRAHERKTRPADPSAGGHPANPRDGGRPAAPRDSTAAEPRTRYTPAHVQHEVVSRDHDMCQFVSDDGITCGETRDVQFHHQQSFASGGEQTAENLIRFCRAHNMLMAERELGRTFMNNFRRLSP